MFEQSFKNIDNELHKDAGCSTEMDYIEQTSWLLFLKYLEDLENNRARKPSLTAKNTRRSLMKITLGAVGHIQRELTASLIITKL